MVYALHVEVAVMNVLCEGLLEDVLDFCISNGATLHS